MKFVYDFKEGNGKMRELLGGKGANLAEMTNLGMPVPQGFTVSTEACTKYYDDGKKITDEIVAEILRKSGKNVIVVVNKVDDGRSIYDTYAFHALGLGDPISISAISGSGTGDLLDKVLELLPEKKATEQERLISLKYHAFELVRRAGFEPAAFTFGVCYSIP